MYQIYINASTSSFKKTVYNIIYLCTSPAINYMQIIGQS